ncbi:MAG TPA: MarC family protein [Polyangiales bacterium]|nr:MarC family protein [Polyangiales bacterium]
MQNQVLHVLTVFMGFFAIMNPIANTPIFLGLTEGDSADIRRAVARRALLVTFLIIVVFTISGRMIFELFGIGLPAFQITGGLLVLLIGFHMVQGHASRVQHPGNAGATPGLEGELDKAISPLAMPLLAGPGTISTAINFASQGGIGPVVTTLVTFFALCVITYFFFVYGERLVRYLGHAGMSIITRLMGLILAVIGTQMVIGGITGAIKLAAS